MNRAVVRSLVCCGLLALPCSAGARVLRVGTYKGIRGQFRSIQAAVDAARPGDWILIGPGDYKEHSGRAPKGRADTTAGVLITTPGIYLRGMNRNTVIVDGTRPGSAACNRRESDQGLGPRGGGGRLGLNGVLVWKAADVWVQNMTVCNYLHGTGDTGNEIWWNGGDGEGKIGGHGYLGSYLTATSTFFNNEETAAQYGIFSSNWNGGTWDQTYASNFNDSGYYIGACQQVCNQVINHAHAQYNALGYSGTNSGGSFVIKNSEFDHNEDGFDTNSQNADYPPPQNGACPDGKVSPITHTHSCWVFMDNYVHDNNNPNVPSAGSAAAGPVGTGMSISGGHNDTIMHNRFVRNGAWGVIVLPYPDSGPPCTGGTFDVLGPGTCLYDPFGVAVLDNQFSGNGFFGHPTNGDIATLNLKSGNPTNCFHGNTEAGGRSARTSPSDLQKTHPACTGAAVPANPNPPFLAEALCDTQVSLTPGPPACPSGQYPRRTHVVMHPLPKALPTMPDPCAKVPANPWCPAAPPPPPPPGLG
jgi:hypothetical protein